MGKDTGLFQQPARAFEGVGLLDLPLMLFVLRAQVMMLLFSPPQLDEQRTHIRIPRRVSSKAGLLTLLKDGLHFPDYFGANWDALEECIRDLTWLASKQVVISHADVPLSEDRRASSIYLSILADAAEYWDRQEEHDLYPVFPREFEDEIEDLLRILNRSVKHDRK